MRQKFAVLGLVCASVPLMAASGHAPDHINWVELIARVVNFVLFAWVLLKFLKEPVVEFFTSRRLQIERDLEMARSSRLDAEKRLAEIQEKMQQLDEEIARITAQARAESEVEKDRLRQSAEEEAKKINEQAQERILRERAALVSSLKADVVNEAIREVETLLRQRLDDQTTAGLMADFAERLKAS
jgi:F-type H+-transporting ATPase subunit b